MVVAHQPDLPGCGVESDPADAACDRLLAVDRTPIPVVRQILERLRSESTYHDPRIVDVGCGEGAWSSVARGLWPDAEIVGVELRPEAAEHAREWCDEVIVGDFRGIRPGEADLVIGNPPFADFVGGRRVNLFPALIKWGLGLLPPGGTMTLLGLGDLGQRGASSRATFAAHPPAEQWRIAGAIGFRGPRREDVHGGGASDVRCYSAWVWRVRGEPRAPGWRTLDLPPLPTADRRWATVPGT